MSIRRQTSFTGPWEDFHSNSREELLKMMNDLELPVFPSMTGQQMAGVLDGLFQRNSDLQSQAFLVYVKDRQHPRLRFSPIIFRALFVILAALLIWLGLHKIFAPQPYCSPDRRLSDCRPCPDRAVCVKGRVSCPKRHYLTIVGCRPKSERKSYRAAAKASVYITERDGDCIEPQPHLSIEAFAELFPKTNMSFIESEPGFGLITVNGTVRSLKPRPGLVCRILAKMDENTEMVGFCTFVVIVWWVWRRFQKKARGTRKLARRIAQEVCKILSTTDHDVYQYDMKVQFRTKYPKIDEIWKYVVRFVEENSQVCVGVVGSRHEVYWKWIRLVS